MITTKYLDCVIEKIAPLSLSKAFIEKGGYDNSGLLIKTHEDINGILFTLDLNEESIKKAVKEGCDTIITHHPAIYTPLKSLTEENKAVLLAVKKNLNVYSLHLNLDIADDGIDQSLAKGLGAKSTKILEYVTETNGYGREFEIEKTTLEKYVKMVKEEFGSNKIIFYGKKTKEIKKVASFCGAGGSNVLDYLGDADLVVSSDLPHHAILKMVEEKRAVMIIPHYVAEFYGFKKFYEKIKELKIKTTLFEDKRYK
ncbi:MAG: Nif3-like dinuclear metal center hexameric protein [Clostridiales bacterium]|nr:Nif3-like dinuclear metal center hexameric protein [Clostridiales bacterium]